MRNRLQITYTYILINIERVSKHSVTFIGLRVVTTCWSWAWSNRTSPSKWVGFGSPLAACSVYGDFTCTVHTVNNLCMFNCQCYFYLCNRGPYVRLAFCQICYPREIKILLLLLLHMFKKIGWRFVRQSSSNTKAWFCFLQTMYLSA